MIPFLANIDRAFKVLAPRAADWLTILPEIAVAALALVSLLQAILLPKPLRWLIPATARAGLVLVIAMAYTTAGPWAPKQSVSRATQKPARRMSPPPRAGRTRQK